MSSAHEKKASKQKDINAIEADMAYFGARIAFSQRGEQTAYKRAQRKACEALSRSLEARLRKLQAKSEETRPGEGS